MEKKLVVLLFLLSIPFSPIWAKTFLLEWKWKKGEKLSYREVLEISSAGGPSGATFQGRGKLEREFSIQALSISKTRGFQLKIHWKRIVFHLKRGPGQEIHFDSRKFKKNPNLQKDPFLKNLFAFYQKEIVLRILPSGKILSSSKVSDFSNLPWGNFFLLPLRPLEMGDFWHKKSGLDIWNTNLKTQSKYQLGKVEKYKNRLCVKISQKGKLSLKPSTYSRYKRLQPRVTRSVSLGWKLFDFQKGKLVAVQNKVDFQIAFHGKRGGKPFSMIQTMGLKYHLELVEP